MKGSPIFPGFDTDYTDSSSYEFDLQTDFAQFLEEARKHANGKEELPRQRSKSQPPQLNAQEKRKKKSWKTTLFSFFKSSENKNKNKNKQHPLVEASMGSHSTNPKRRAHVSGPVHRHHVSGPVPNTDVRHRPRASGPLAGLFHGKKREKVNDIPYVSLDMLTSSQHGIGAKTYGPIYLVS